MITTVCATIPCCKPLQKATRCLPVPPPTLCRMMARATRSLAIALNELSVVVFIESFQEALKELILDFDATDDEVHGNQIGRAFHGYYDHHCFLPPNVFCDSQPLVAWLRPSDTDRARGAWLVLRRLAECSDPLAKAAEEYAFDEVVNASREILESRW